MTRFLRSLFGTVLVGGLIVALGTGSPTVAQDKTKPKAKAAKPPVKPEYSTPAATLKVAKDFTAELLYVVPKETQGSWVNLPPPTILAAPAAPVGEPGSRRSVSADSTPPRFRSHPLGA